MQPGSAFPPPMGFAAPVSLPTIDASDFAGRRVPSRQWFVFELIPRAPLRCSRATAE